MDGINNMRLALISTPRSGNTWLRLLLGDLFNLSHFAVHTPSDLDWGSLPEDCIVQLHWPRTDHFVGLLDTYGFRTITICRHPLDVLLSILNFAKYERQTACWLSGKGGDESQLIGKSPTSQDFLQYCCGVRAENLLNITSDWWPYADVLVKYEELVSNSEVQLGRIVEALNEPISRTRILKAIEIFAFKNLRPTSANQHYWKGLPGHWSAYIPASIASEIYDHHRRIFEEFGYNIIVLGGSWGECEMRWIEES